MDQYVSTPASASLEKKHLKSGFKSWRKKYRKMRIKYDESVKESTALFVEQHRALALAKRLQEQNYQLLDMLYELNESLQKSPGVRHTSPVFSSPGSREAKDKRASEHNLNNGHFIDLDNPFHNLRNVPHTKLDPGQIPEELRIDPPPGYLTPTHEEDFLTNLDIHLSNSTPAYHHLHRLARPRVVTSRTTLSEKEIMLQNPTSVYNWLRRNQPQVFERDNEPGVEKSGGQAKASRASGKRSTAAAAAAAAAAAVQQPKTEQELFDETIGFFPEQETFGTSKGKRNRDDEPYRPKGGSSRPAKRKREDGEKGPKKKPRPSGGSAEKKGAAEASMEPHA